MHNMTKEIPLPAECIPPTPPQMGGKEDLFQKQKTCNYFQLHLRHSSDLCSLKGDLPHAVAHEPMWSTSTGELHQKSAAENVAAAKTACKEVSGLTTQCTSLKWEKQPAILQPKDVVLPDRNKEFRGEASRVWMWLLNREQLGAKMVFELNKTVPKNREKEGEGIRKR